VVELERSSSRGGSPLMLRVTAPVAAWACLAYLAVQVAALVRSLSVRMHLPNPTLVFLTLTFITALVAWGALCGSVLPPPVAPVAAAGAAYLVALVQSVYSYDSAVARLFPVIQERWDPAMKPNVGRLLLASLWLVALAAVLHTLAARDRRLLLSARIAPVLIVGVSVTAAPLVVPPVVATDSFYGKTRDDGDPHTCRDVAGGGRVCLYAADAWALPTFIAGYRKAAAAAGGLNSFPNSVVGAGLSGPAPAMVYELLDPPTVDGVAAAILDYTAAPISPDPQVCATPPPFSPIGDDDLAHVIQAVLHGRAGLPVDRQLGRRSRSFIDSLGRLDRPTQNRWLEGATAAYAECRSPDALANR
jgi:hypothetical protein